MHPSLTQLQKILLLEAKDRYPNKAVIGGLPKLMRFWEPNARRAGLPNDFIEGLEARLKAYPEMPVEKRPAAIDEMLEMIKELDKNFNPAPQTARPPQPKAPPAPQRGPSQPPAARSADKPSAPKPAEAKLPRPAPASPKPETIEPAKPAQPPAPKAPPVVEPIAASAAPATPRPTVPPEHKPAVKPHPHSEPRSRRASSPQPVRSATPLNTTAGIDAPLTVLYGIGPEKLRLYDRMGLRTLRDLLLYFPRRYDNYSAMKPINRLEYGEECSVIGTIWEAHTRKIKNSGASMLKVLLSDSTGVIEITFFNQQWLEDKLTPGKQIVISGRVDQYLGRLTLVPDEWEYLDQELLNTGRIVPVYRLTSGVSERSMRKLTAQVAQYWARKQPDALPEELVKRAGLLAYGEALAQVHFPDNEAQLAAARHRLAFDELLLLQLGVLRQRQEWQAATAAPLAVPDDWLAKFVADLPYPLTNAQQRALTDLRADLNSPVPMNRLLQGDVGSGKTVVAAAGMALAVQAGAQAALMAPTSILAEQHYQTLSNLLTAALGLPASALRLLQGSTPAAEKEAVYAGLRSGEIKVIVGTHALIEAPVEFARLGLAVVDEQHRFGVAQRAALRNKGANPHLLVMTATPIPRSLALTVYGDLDLSVLDEMPPGRQPIQTHILHAHEHERGYGFIRAQIQKGRQAFIIFPLVEESEKIEAKAAVEEHGHLQKEVFPEFKLGLLHGRMRPEEKDDVMTRFRAGEYQILVSTSVVEVGVDVPNAVVMLVEGAHRFGLAQLHQFRGRVGRGPHASYCLLVSDAPNPRADERLLAMEQSQDGFYLAEKDLELRGPGDFLGTRQSGFAGLQMAKLSDLPTIEKARREAKLIFERDPQLQAPEHKALAENLTRFWSSGAGDVS